MSDRKVCGQANYSGPVCKSGVGETGWLCVQSTFPSSQTRECLFLLVRAKNQGRFPYYRKDQMIACKEFKNA